MGGKAKPGKLGSQDKASCLCLASCCAGMLSPWKSSFAVLSAKRGATQSIGCRDSVYLCSYVCANAHPGVYVCACVCVFENVHVCVCTHVYMCAEAPSSSPLCLALSSYKGGSVLSLSIVLNADYLIRAHKANTNRQGVIVCLSHHSITITHTHTHKTQVR